MIASLSVVAIFLIAFLPLRLGAKTVKLVEICSSGSRVNMVVYRYNPVTLRMTSGAWEADQLSCTATFRAEDLDETLYYHFSDYANTDGTELRLERKRSVTFVSEGTYSAARTPALEYAKKADTYLRVTVDRDSLVISHGFNFTLVISNKGNSGLLSSLSSGTVVGSVVGGGASIIGLALVIVLCRSKTRRRAHWRRSGTTNPGVSTMTVCTTTPGVYQMPPHTMQRRQLPSYPSGYPQPAHASLCQQPVQSWGPSQAVAVSAYLPANNLPAYGQHGTAPGYPLPPSGSTIPPTHHPNGGLSNAHGDGPNLPGYVSHRPEYRSAAPPTYESLGFTDNNKS